MSNNLLIKEKVAETYDNLSGVYNLFTGIAEKKTRERILELSGIKNGDTVLEVAVGTGLIFSELVKANPGGKNYGIDLSEKMLSEAEKLVKLSGNNFILKRGDAYNPDFEDNFFDLLVNSYMFDLLPESDFLKVLEGFKRILKPGGRFVIANLYPENSPFYFLWESLYRVNPSLVGWCRGIKLIDFIRKSGFKVETSEIIKQFGFSTQVISGIKPVENLNITIDELLLVYNAEFSLSGGMEYLLEFASTGKEPCVLCSITHSGVLEKQEWKNCKMNLGISVRPLYLNQLDEKLRQVVDGDTPCILARSGENISKLLGSKEIESCKGNPEKLNMMLLERI